MFTVQLFKFLSIISTSLVASAGCPTGCSICDSAGLCVEDGCGADQVQTNDVVKECVGK